MRFRTLSDRYLGFTKARPLRSTRTSIEIGLQPTQDVTEGTARTAPTAAAGGAVGLPANAPPPDALKGIANLVEAMAPDHVESAGAYQSKRRS